MTPDVDIIIVSYNTRETLLACLASIAEHPPSALGRVVVVDNASDDGSVAAVRLHWPAVHVIALDRNVGFGSANNAAIRASTATHVLLLNSDTVVGPGALDTLMARLIATGATAAGPRLVDGDGRFEVSFGRMLSPVNELVQAVRTRASAWNHVLARKYIARLVADEREVDWVSGACLLVRRAAALEAGLFDERFFLYEEDVDFCAALRAKGGRILFTPRAQIVHLRGRSMATTEAPAAASGGGAPRATPAPAAAAPSESTTLRQAQGRPEQSRGASRVGEASPRPYDRSHLLFYEKHLPRWAAILRWWQAVRGRG